MKLSDEVVEDLTYWGTFAADTAAIEERALGATNAQITRRIVRRTIEALAANDLIHVPEIRWGENMQFIPDPPFDVVFGPERRPIINKFHDDGDTPVARSENDLCECDRPDQRDEPHRHKIDVACVYWMAGRPSVSDRVDAMRQLNIEKVAV